MKEGLDLVVGAAVLLVAVANISSSVAKVDLRFPRLHLHFRRHLVFAQSDASRFDDGHVAANTVDSTLPAALLGRCCSKPQALLTAANSVAMLTQTPKLMVNLDSMPVTKVGRRSQELRLLFAAVVDPPLAPSKRRLKTAQCRIEPSLWLAAILLKALASTHCFLRRLTCFLQKIHPNLIQFRRPIGQLRTPISWTCLTMA